MKENSGLSYLITFRESNHQRTNVLAYILKQVITLKDIEICLVEQDSEPRITHLVEDYSSTPLKYIFVENAGAFNKSWGLNIAATLASGTQLLFADADMLISDHALNIVRESLDSTTDAINPYNQLIDLSDSETEHLFNGTPLINVTRSESQMNRRHLGQTPPFCGGVFAITRQVFERCGGLDERFEGWGGDDNAISHRVLHHANRSITLEETAFHLWHGREEQPQQATHPYIRNVALLSLYYEQNQNFYESIANTDLARSARLDKYSKTSSDLKKGAKSRTPGPRVSCLCVTRNRVSELQRAIACFLRQDYANKELCIVVEDDDRPSITYLEQLEHADIRINVVAAKPKMTLGELRNLSIEFAQGAYICQWDDDDWYHPKRLSRQMDNALTNKKAASILSRWLIYDVRNEQIYCSNIRLWEGSLLCAKVALPELTPYSSMQRGEDSDLIARLYVQDQLAVIDCPELYVYHCNGINTWDSDHFENIIAASHKLEKKESDSVKRVLASSFT